MCKWECNFTIHILNITISNRRKRFGVGDEMMVSMGVCYKPTQPNLQYRILRSRWNINENDSKFSAC